MKGNNKESNSRKSLKYRGTECLNCGHPLDRSDIYCPNCSQLNSKKHLSLSDFFAEFLSSILVYDSRLRNTIKDLLFKPGVITRNYVKGQRLKYANPFRFFLSVSIIYFLLQGLVSYINPSDKSNIINVSNSSPEKDSIAKVVEKKAEERPYNKDLQLAAKYLSDSISDENFKLIQKETEAAAESGTEYYSEEELDTMSFVESYYSRNMMYIDFYSEKKIENPQIALDSLHHLNTPMRRWLYSRAVAFTKINDNPSSFINYLTSKVPFFLFFFTPFYAFFFWLIYSRKKFSYMEHMIFVFHIFSFVFLSLLILRIPDIIFNIDVFQKLLFLIFGPIYFYKALRNFYGQKRFITILKFVFLNIIFFLGFGLGTVLFVVANAAIY